MTKNPYRTKIDVVARILKVALNGANKTMIIFLARLSNQMASRYLEHVLYHRLVTYDKEKNLYKTSQKGREFFMCGKTVQIHA